MTHHDDLRSAIGSADLPVIALVGRPNVGKSTFLAHASGRFAETANAPGTTVGLEVRRVAHRGREALIVDLPGTVSLLDESDGIAPFWQLLLSARPDAILVVADAGDLARHLPLALACRDTGLPIVLAANMTDDARRAGVVLDTGRLSQLLAAPVHETVARTGEGVDDAVGDAVRLAVDTKAARSRGVRPRLAEPAGIYPPLLERQLAETARYIARASSLGAAVYDPRGLKALVDGRAIGGLGAASIELADALEAPRWAVSARWAAQVERRILVPSSFRERLARGLVAPWPGLPIFVAVTVLSFVAMMIAGSALSAVLNVAWAATASPALATAIPAVVPWAPIAGALTWTLDGGVIAMLSVGIPYVLTFYLVLAALEDSGYLTSAAVLADRFFNLLGLPGRAAIPLLAATGCNVPAIYGTRVLATRRERLLAAFLITMTPCSARSAVVIAALAPFAGPWVALGAFAAIGTITVAAGLAANALVPGRQPASVMELAPLRMPLARQVSRKAWGRFRAFITTAAPLMLIGSFVLGLAYEGGLIRPVERAIGPFVSGWLGLPPVVGIALVFAFLRKELALQLLVVLAVAEIGAGATSIGSFLSPAQLFVYAVITAVSVPCVATLATLIGEFGRRAALLMTAGTLGIALLAGGLIARMLGVA